MPLLRHLPLTCPTCGHTSPYILEPTEHAPLVTLVPCEACLVPFGVEVRLTVTIETHVCRLALPSARRPDALEEVQTLAEPEDASDF